MNTVNGLPANARDACEFPIEIDDEKKEPVKYSLIASIIIDW